MPFQTKTIGSLALPRTSERQQVDSRVTHCFILLQSASKKVCPTSDLPAGDLTHIAHQWISLHDVGLLLWQAAAANVNLVAVLAQIADLIGALEQALRIRSLCGAGLIQLMTCDHARCVLSFMVKIRQNLTKYVRVRGCCA